MAPVIKRAAEDLNPLPIKATCGLTIRCTPSACRALVDCWVSRDLTPTFWDAATRQNATSGLARATSPEQHPLKKRPRRSEAQFNREVEQ